MLLLIMLISFILFGIIYMGWLGIILIISVICFVLSICFCNAKLFFFSLLLIFIWTCLFCGRKKNYKYVCKKTKEQKK